MFGHHAFDPEKTHGRKKNRAARGVKEGEAWRSVDMESGDESASDDGMRDGRGRDSGGFSEGSHEDDSDGGVATQENEEDGRREQHGQGR